MKKEAINTFGEGLIMDLNPLTTPNNVLTNALNGTIVTYNGNEFVLQNDMGNGEVHTAYLDKGYVPVGMKEHGGIIYVAAHNPVNGKSQLGSFPSPQQLYEGDDLNVAPIDFRFSNFIDIRNGLPFIKLEYYKQKLFQENNTGELKIFHPGDKFVIVSDVLSNTLRNAIKNKVIRLRLGVVNSSGNIDYIADDGLKLYSNGLWIYENSNTPMVDVLRSNELVQVFSAKSSGALILVIEFKTFDTFSLMRKYAYADKTITVTMVGDTTGVYTGKTTINPNIKLLYENELKSNIVIKRPEDSKDKVPYSVMPACPYGILERMEKQGVLDFEAIRSNKETFGEWRFFVTDTYLKIGWGYDYYNLNEDEDIENIRFTFININRSAQATSVATMSGDYAYTMSKEYFNGSFEEIIPFDDATIQRNWVYLVRIDKSMKGLQEPIGYRLLYTGTYFNDSFEENSDFTQLKKALISLNVSSEVRKTVKSKGALRTYLKNTKTGSFVEKYSLSASDYITTVNSVNADTSNYQYTTRKTGLYDIEIAPAVDYNYDEKVYAGVPASLENFFGSGTTLSNSIFTDENIAYNSTSPTISNIPSSNSTIVSTSPFRWDSSTKSLKGQVETSRSMFALAGEIKSINVSSEVLAPAYSGRMNTGELSKLFSFRDVDGILYCVTGDRSYCCYNSKILGEPHTSGDGNKGVDCGSGSDDAGLRVSLAAMGNGTVGIFGGHDHDDASLSYEARRRTVDGWSCSKNEVDNEDNFLLGTWKDVEGKHWVINLASQKTSPNNVTSNNVLIRLDKMLKCFLSQMCVVTRDRADKIFVGPNSLDFVYHTSFDTTFETEISINGGGSKQTVEFFLDKNSKSISEHVKAWKTVIDTLPKAKGLSDFLPTFEMTKPTTIKIYIPFGSNVRVDNDSALLSYYTSAYASAATGGVPIDIGIDRGRIYIAESTGVSRNDGSMELATDAYGRVRVKSSDRTLVDWRNRSVTLLYGLNETFTTAYSKDNTNTEIKEGFYNEILLKVPRTVIGDWAKGDSAPDMAINASFGTKSIYT